MRAHLHDVAAGLALALAVGQEHRGNLADQLGRVFDAATAHSQAAAEATRHAWERLREIGLRIAVGTPGSGGEAAAGQLAGLSVAKAIPACAAGALAAVCVAAGVLPVLDPSEPVEHRRVRTSRDHRSQPASVANDALTRHTPRLVSPAPSFANDGSTRERQAIHEGKAPAARPRPRPASEHPVRSDAQQTGVEFGADAAGAGQPYSPPPSAVPTQGGSAADGGDQVTRSRSAGAAPEKTSPGSSEFGL
jgi:hypothetical protein